jgi:hypothetical protein
MAKLQITGKQLQISKANLMIVVVMSIACFVTIFSLVASRSLLAQRSYQARVITQKDKAKTQLVSNLAARDQLVTQYKVFAESSVNIIGGSATGGADKDGDNARIILDALPSKYDFPALATSLEKLLNQSGLATRSISGTDDEIAQGTANGSSSSSVIDMPFDLSFEGEYTKTQSFMSVLERSIRPIQVMTLSITGNDKQLSTTLTAKTFYQPEKNLSIKSEVVK